MPPRSRCPPSLLAAALPADPARQSFSAAELAEVAALPFLDSMVERALAAGAAPYLTPEARGKATEGQSKGLRFEAYEPAPFAVPLSGASTSYGRRTVRALILWPLGQCG
ncbi:hypothetical protein GPECTOR_224g492 [Gonium pectorale]|uniref:Uncharacterized protein n=1 Tax=Gonium pectorale TaxID=33097 RepID=A0A150FWQ9_GONPE|nr:hypothetical protein GPECTOR_224g492 [Gonium pectorale]|eukprot:KXZ42008.1 hypothetical protein GPECTOR_224g492 [Gonium pectorale]